MLLELNVKDIALVRKARVEFGSGVNILTGETGTGKSVIIDSAMLALGGKARTDIIRQGAEYAYVELIFDVDEVLRRRLKAADIETEDDGQLIISRKLMPGKSISRINDETVTVAALRKAAALLLDVYGQNEYYTLKEKHRHLELLDEYAGDSVKGSLTETAQAYADYKEAAKAAESFNLDDKERARQADLIAFELNEIDEAGLKSGEEEELTLKFKKLNNARRILESVSVTDSILSECDTGRAAAELEHALRYDEELKTAYDELMDAQSILNSCIADLRAYSDGLELDEEALAETEARLDLIRRLELKYGQSIEEILQYRERIAAELDKIRQYDDNKATAQERLLRSEERLNAACEVLSRIRKKEAEKFSRAIEQELKDLGFEKPKISMEFVRRTPSADGYDDVCFMSALNPGEKEKPLAEVASGGELSRVMLAIKTILAESDDMPTLIFDEIDTGISGRTAQRVAEKLDVIGMKHQVICVSHLPQIAAMADTHFVISKTEQNGRNITNITKLDKEGSVEELARLLGGEKITKAVSDNAAELLELAQSGKRKRRKA